MKPTQVADEMFPEGAGPYMDLEEVKIEYNNELGYVIMLKFVLIFLHMLF